MTACKIHRPCIVPKKHSCGKRRECWLPAFLSFFSKVVFIRRTKTPGSLSHFCVTHSIREIQEFIMIDCMTSYLFFNIISDLILRRVLTWGLFTSRTILPEPIGAFQNVITMFKTMLHWNIAAMTIINPQDEIHRACSLNHNTFSRQLAAFPNDQL